MLTQKEKIHYLALFFTSAFLTAIVISPIVMNPLFVGWIILTFVGAVVCWVLSS